MAMADDNVVHSRITSGVTKAEWRMVGGAGDLSRLTLVDSLTLDPIDPNRVRVQTKFVSISADCHSFLLMSPTYQRSSHKRAIGLNFADIFACLGLYSATPQGDFVPGLEFSGIVVDVGSSCSTELQVRIANNPRYTSSNSLDMS